MVFNTRGIRSTRSAPDNVPAYYHLITGITQTFHIRSYKKDYEFFP